jgi:hypothetical protein
VVNSNLILPGFRETEESDSNLSVVLDSLLPCFNELCNPEQLPIYLGKKAVEAKVDIGSSSSQSEKGGKAFTWSRGLATELSPIKTRSARKKHVSSSSIAADSNHSSQDTGALRAMKALARAK